METRFAWLIRAKTVFLYAGLEHSVETTRADAAQRYSQACGLLSQVQSQLAALQPMLIQIGEETLHTWMDQDPALKTYQHIFKDIFRKQAHIRSEEVETLLGLLRDPFAGTSAIARMLTNADIQFQPAITQEGEQVELTQGSKPKLMMILIAVFVRQPGNII